MELFPSQSVAIRVLGFSLYWYGILYLVAFITARAILPRLQVFRGLALTSDDWNQLMSWTIVGVIIGGRLGYCLLYDPWTYIAHPLQILAIRDGGMAFHGGLLGVTVTLAFFARAKNIRLLRLTDVVVVPAAIGLMFGRLGNFLNGELYGTVSTLPWAMSFPDAEGLRHPVQIYAMIKDALLALLCLFLVRKKKLYQGIPTSIFLIGYGVLRYAMEFVREQQYPLHHFNVYSFSRGQLYCLPMIALGIALFIYALKFQRE